MANTITLRRRIKSIGSTRQITKAMELVSASKMRRAQDYAFRSRAYRQAAYDLLLRLSTIPDVERQPLFRVRPVKTRLYILITSSSGLAGAYNSNVLRLFSESVKDDQAGHVKSQVIAIGNKGAQFVRRISGLELTAVYPALGDQPTANDIRPILNSVIDGYRQAAFDEVKILYTQFKSNLVQEAQGLVLLPAKTNTTNAKADFSNFEPDVETVIHQTAIRLIEAQIWQDVLESLASEHSMRMLAMKNATDNANDLIDEYTLEYNTARQASITQELAEITGGAEALQNV